MKRLLGPKARGSSSMTKDETMNYIRNRGCGHRDEIVYNCSRCLLSALEVIRMCQQGIIK